MTQTVSSEDATASRQAPGGQNTDVAREQSWVYFNGRFERYGEAKLGLMTHGLHYGTGCFEGIRAYWDPKHEQLWTFRMPEHYERMQTSAHILKIALPHGVDELCDITKELLRRNGYRQDVYIRPLAYKSAEIIGVMLHDVPDGFLIYTSPFGNYVDIEAGLRCMVSSWRRVDDNAAPARAKCTGTYVNSALAKSEALENGFDEAIMLNSDGNVCEGSAENIFLVRRGQFITPSVNQNILEGITRATIMHLIREELGLEVVERPIARTELYAADEIFLCGTGAQVSPVVEIDRRRVGDGEPGPLTLRLQDEYFKLCKGENDAYRDWLTPVY